MSAKNRCFGEMLFVVASLLVSFHALAQTVITPERYNKGPRILFNMYSEADKESLEQVIPGSFHQKFWQTPRSSIQHGIFYQSKKGEPFKSALQYHGEEIIIMIEGELEFKFPESNQSFVLHKGDVFNFPNILHGGGGCRTEVCHFIAVYSPNRPDFGPEGTPMTSKSNMYLDKPVINY